MPDFEPKISKWKYPKDGDGLWVNPFRKVKTKEKKGKSKGGRSSISRKKSPKSRGKKGGRSKSPKSPGKKKRANSNSDESP